jgi:hypothetical protein
MKEVPVRSTSRFTRVPALIGASALVVAALAGCTALPGFGGCDPVYGSGDSSSVVTASGSAGATPTVDFPTPLVSPTPEVSVIAAGDGEQIAAGSQVDYTYTVFSGADGSTLSAEGAAGRVATGIRGTSISEAFVCTHVGDRIALTTTIADAFGAGAGANAQLADDDTVVLVIDTTAAYLGKADGFNQLPQDGLPVVVTDVDGTPAISLAFVTAPKVTRVETVKAGDGSTISKDDQVVVNLRAWTWPAAEGDTITEYSDANTWPGHRAYTATLADSDTNPLPPGVRAAIVGAKVGSQLLVVLPPGDDNYATPPQGLTADSTLIWVVDILGIQKS